MTTPYFTVRGIKQHGKIQASSFAVKKQFEVFLSHIPDGSIVEIFYEVQKDDGTLPQLAKLHVMIRELAMFTGESVENMKLLIKDRAGLCIAKEVSGKEFLLAKSFGDCSREDLSLAIQAAIDLGNEINCPVG